MMHEIVSMKELINDFLYYKSWHVLFLDGPRFIMVDVKGLTSYSLAFTSLKDQASMKARTHKEI